MSPRQSLHSTLDCLRISVIVIPGRQAQSGLHDRKDVLRPVINLLHEQILQLLGSLLRRDRLPLDGARPQIHRTAPSYLRVYRNSVVQSVARLRASP
jgi:hypothetical protein